MRFLLGIFFFCFWIGTSLAHPLIPLEVLDFMEANPQATDEDIEAFFQKNFGSIEEYYGIPQEEQDFTLRDLYVQPSDYPMLSNAEKEEYQKEQERLQKNINIFLELQNGKMGIVQQFFTFVFLGITHILGGMDHILFVLSLILLLPPWKKILAYTTTFTLAHSLTLLLAGTGILTLSSRIVEPIIAFSIGYMAVSTVFGNTEKIQEKIIRFSSLLTIFIFGLFHGLGFAGLLNDFQIPAGKTISSLLFFNIGIEIGQIIVLALALPLLFLLSKTKYFPSFTRASAFLLAVISAFWFAERVVG